MIADHDRGMERLRESQDKTELTLRRAIRLSVKEWRHQRKRNVEFEELMKQLISAQLRTEDLVKKFLERGGNGKH